MHRDLLIASETIQLNRPTLDPVVKRKKILFYFSRFFLIKIKLKSDVFRSCHECEV
jgi:hypothetical protein